MNWATSLYILKVSSSAQEYLVSAWEQLPKLMSPPLFFCQPLQDQLSLSLSNGKWLPRSSLSLVSCSLHSSPFPHMPWCIKVVPSQAAFPTTACSGADPVLLLGAISLKFACFLSYLLPNLERDLHGTRASTPSWFLLSALYFYLLKKHGN